MESKNQKLFALFLMNSLGIIFYLFESVISPYELTYGIFLTGIYWFLFMLIPAMIPIFTNRKFWKYSTFIIGVIVTLINSAIGIGYMVDNQLKFGLLLLLYWGILGITASVNTFKWIKQ